MSNIRTYFSGSLKLKYLLIVLVALIIADGLISESIVSGGSGFESNLILRTLMDNGNFLFVKVSGALVGAIILWNISKAKPGLALSTTVAFATIYTLIVYWNIGVFLIDKC